MNERTRYSQEQVLLSSERTALSWTRTSASLMAFGFVIEKFGLYFSADHLTSNLLRHSLWMGVFFIVLGAGAAFFSIYQYHEVRRRLKTDGLPPGYSMLVVPGINAIVGFLGLFLALGIVLDFK